MKHNLMMSATVMLVASVTSGCAVSSESASPSESVGQTESALISCPDTQNAKIAAQVEATQALRYVFGDDNALSPGNMGDPSCLNLKVQLKYVRAVLRNSAAGTLTNGGSGTRCGIPALLYNWSGLPGMLPTPATLETAMNTCWSDGSNVMAFFYTSSDNTQATFDPSTAQLTANLSGSNGATAAAYDVDTHAATTVVKWPSTYTGGSGQPVAGTPCSTLNLAAGQQTTQAVLSNGSYSKCI